MKPEKKRAYRPNQSVDWVPKIETEWTDFERYNGYSIADAHAIQCLYTGTATAAQQMRAINFIVNVVAKKYDLHYFETDRDTTFALGKGFVGDQIVKLSKLDTTELEKVIKARSTPQR